MSNEERVNLAKKRRAPTAVHTVNPVNPLNFEECTARVFTCCPACHVTACCSYNALDCLVYMFKELLRRERIASGRVP